MRAVEASDSLPLRSVVRQFDSFGQNSHTSPQYHQSIFMEVSLVVDCLPPYTIKWSLLFDGLSFCRNDQTTSSFLHLIISTTVVTDVSVYHVPYALITDFVSPRHF